jgi:hypothetical protein
MRYLTRVEKQPLYNTGLAPEITSGLDTVDQRSGRGAHALEHLRVPLEPQVPCDKNHD